MTNEVRKHLYFHSSNFDQFRELRDDPMFEYDFEYPKIPDQQHQYQYEYGRIKTEKNYYHFIFGTPKQEGCPWCAGSCEIIEGVSQDAFAPIKYYIQCIECGARGPTLNVTNIHDVIRTQDKGNLIHQYIAEFLWQRFKTRRPWDDGLINPYEKSNE